MHENWTPVTHRKRSMNGLLGPHPNQGNTTRGERGTHMHSDESKVGLRGSDTNFSSKSLKAGIFLIGS
jgi:hypothetical protein